MKTKKLLIFFISCFCLLTSVFAARKTVEVDKITTSLTLSEAVDYHITASEECIAEGVTVDLTHEDAWLFFDNVQPNTVKSQWLSRVKLNGEPIQAQQNAWVNIYKHGAVVIPYGKDFTPFTVYTGELYGGDVRSFAPGRYSTLGTFDNKIKSFKLKRGYMATVAQGRDGSGYSRVFIAQDDDIEIPNLLDKAVCTNGGALYDKISYIRVMRWQMPSKKGAIDTDPVKTNSTWYYNYDASLSSKSDNLEYSNMWHHVAWNRGAISANQSDISGVTHTLGFNEPWNPSDDGYMGTDALAPIPNQYDLIKNGTRIGSMAATDGNVGKTRAFIQECDRLGLRVDFVAIHVYQYHDAEWWYNYTRDMYNATGRPIWITEWNNGANWTSESWPSDLAAQWVRSRDLTAAIIKRLDEAPWVERYSLYNAVEIKRNIVYQGGTTTITIDGEEKTYNNGDLTPAGEAYKAFQAGMAFNPDYQFIPKYPVFVKPEVTVSTALLMSLGQVRISIDESNGEYYDKCVIEKKVGNGEYEVLVEEQTSSNYTDRWDMDNPQKTSYRLSFYYCNETTPRFTEESSVDVEVAEEGGPLRYGLAAFSKPDWSYVMFKEFANATAALPILGAFPTAILAGKTNQFVSTLNSSIGRNNFRAKLVPWGYIYNYDESQLNSLNYNSTVRVPYLVVDTVPTSLNDHPVEAGKVSRIGKEWVKVRFKNAFTEHPVVFPVLLSNRNYGETKGTGYVRVRNVTPEGFEVRITREDKLSDSSWPLLGEDVGYYAVERGKIRIPDAVTGDTLNIVVDTTKVAVGGLTSTTTSFFPEGACPPGVVPTMISALQSSNDDYTVSLVYSLLNSESVKFYKVRENSVSTSRNVSKDQVGYLLLSTSPYLHPDGITDVKDRTSDFTLYVREGLLYMDGLKGRSVSLYTLNGVYVLGSSSEAGIDISDLPSGYYVVRSDKGEVARFIKK